VVVVDPGRGDLHLTGQATAAIGKAEPLPEAPEDIDRHRRGRPCDVGADEFRKR